MRLQNQRTWAIAFVVAGILIYIILWVIPRPVQLSYASERTCVAWLTFLPGIQRTVPNTKFSVATEGGLRIGNFQLLSTRTCVAPIKSPDAGHVTVALAPFGGWLFQQRISVGIDAAPDVSLDSSKPIPVSRALQLTLSQSDKLYTYYVRVDKRMAQCDAVSGKALLSCNLAPLALLQGKQYQLEVLRAFKSDSPLVALKTTITTLTATTIVDGSVKGNDVVYAKPTELTFITDKPLKSVEATLTQQDATKVVATTTSVKDKTITVTLAAELLREKTYTLKISDLESVDGSSLVEPYVVTFSTSGGPKVTNVSVGQSGVATNARIAVTFDQSLSATQDIGKLVAISGVAAQITRSGNQIIYTLSGGLCTPFTLTIAKG
ncbi:MAG TPA: Ig-like domain-containing protein, partial [Candidatus Saccharimonadia bacterium]|nr:Ig-like domain-containing protein [Candidatus Saccharimonadia bacterium]